MAKDKSVEDTISEKEYTKGMAGSSTLPENDSPGDSESDAGREFLMGLDFEPDENEDPELPMESNEEDRGKRGAAIQQIPKSAKVVSSDQPAP
jgi:hypothetical protein